MVFTCWQLIPNFHLFSYKVKNSPMLHPVTSIRTKTQQHSYQPLSLYSCALIGNPHLLWQSRNRHPWKKYLVVLWSGSDFEPAGFLEKNEMLTIYVLTLGIIVQTPRELAPVVGGCTSCQLSSQTKPLSITSNASLPGAQEVKISFNSTSG